MTAGDAVRADAQRLLIDACLRIGVPFWWQGAGTLLISGAGVRAVIEALESSGEKVIGLEGFELESTVVHPRLDLVYDASLATRGGARTVAAAWSEEIWVDITLSARPAGAD